MWTGYPVVTGCTHDIAEGGEMVPVREERRHRSEDQGSATRPTSLSTEICAALEAKRDHLSRKEEELRLAERACKNALEKIQREQVTWMEKMEIVRMKLKGADEKRKEAKMMLKLHETLQQSGEIMGTMRTVERIIAESPSSARNLPEVGQADASLSGAGQSEGSQSASGVRHIQATERNLQQHQPANRSQEFDEEGAKECVMCKADFSSESFILIKPKEKCRHVLRPCDHIVCGKCAKQVWNTTKRCPVCLCQLTKKPKIFRPIRYQ